jgi:hypothetical protein
MPQFDCCIVLGFAVLASLTHPFGQQTGRRPKRETFCKNRYASPSLAFFGFNNVLFTIHNACKRILTIDFALEQLDRCCTLPESFCRTLNIMKGIL